MLFMLLGTMFQRGLAYLEKATHSLCINIAEYLCINIAEFCFVGPHRFASKMPALGTCLRKMFGTGYDGLALGTGPLLGHALSNA